MDWAQKYAVMDSRSLLKYKILPRGEQINEVIMEDVVRPSYAIYDNKNYYGNQFVCRNCDEPSWQYIIKGKPISEVKLLSCEHCGCHELQRRKAFWTEV